MTHNVEEDRRKEDREENAEKSSAQNDVNSNSSLTADIGDVHSLISIREINPVPIYANHT